MMNITIGNDTIRKALDSVITHNNKEDIIELLNGMLVESHRGCELFIKALLGESLPKLPAIGSAGRFHATNVWYPCKDNTVGSKFNRNGYIDCVVSGHKSLHNYSVIAVRYACINDKGQEGTAECNLTLDEFDIEDFSDEF